MNPRTRYFLVASGLIVVAGLGTGLVAVYNANAPGARARALSELSYVPSDATAVAYADVRHIMDSEFRQRLRAVLPTGEGKDKLFAETGIDVERDIDTVVSGFTPSSSEHGAPIVLLRGRLDAGRIENVALTHGAVIEEYRGRRILRVPVASRPQGDGKDEPALAFLEDGLIAMGPVETVRRAIDAAENRQSVSDNPELMKFVSDVAGSGDAWLAGRLDTMSNHFGLSGPVKDHLSSVQWFSLTAGIDQTVTARLRAETRDAASAEDLRAVVNGALAVGRMMASKDTRFAGMLDSVQSTGTGSRLEVSFTLPPDALNALAAAHQRQ